MIAALSGSRRYFLSCGCWLVAEYGITSTMTAFARFRRTSATTAALRNRGSRATGQAVAPARA
jgi:hypothetical protein